MCCWEEGGTFRMYFAVFDAGYFHVRGLVRCVPAQRMYTGFPRRE